MARSSSSDGPPQRTCEALNCYDPLPPDAPSNQLYCGRKCATRMAQARRRRAKRIEEGKPPTPADIQLAEIEAAKIRRANRANAEIEAHKRKYEQDSPASAGDRGGEGEPVPRSSSSPSTPNNDFLDTPLEFTELDPNPRIRRGAGYVEFVNRGTAELLAKKKITKTEAASVHNVNPSTITGWTNAWLEDKIQQRRREEHSLTPEQRDILQSYKRFTNTFFPRALVPGFHLDWVEALRQAVETGHRHLLLAPQRFGKSELLIRECIRQILLNPDICILWVGKTADLAKKMVGYMRQILEHNEEIKQTFLPEGDEFVPERTSGLPWKNDEFTVATRSETRKSATVTAIGVGGTILGRDADLIVIDDPVDRQMCLSPTEREKVKEWFFTDFISRKEEWTGVVYIGSRQHHEDLPASIIEHNEQAAKAGHDKPWNVTVYQSHNPRCLHELSNPERLEDHTPEENGLGKDCLLWPEFRTAPWLAMQKLTNPEHFERNYQNNPTSDLMVLVRPTDIEHAHKLDQHISFEQNRTTGGWALSTPRTLGQVPPGTSLLVSIDPASAKPNAAILWAYRTSPTKAPSLISDENNPEGDTSLSHQHYQRAVVDIAEEEPGTPGLIELIKRWYDQYRVTTWIFETNTYKDQVRNDRSLGDLRSRLGLDFREHITSASSKHDSTAGIVSMLAAFRRRPGGIMLPNPTAGEKRAKLDRLEHQLLHFDPEVASGGSRKSSADDDLAMALWIGWWWIEQAIRRGGRSTVVDDNIPAMFRQSKVIAGLGMGRAGTNSFRNSVLAPTLTMGRR